MIGGIILGQLAYKKALGGTLTYGQAVGSGVLTMVFASVISGIYTYLLYSVIDPSLQEQMRIFTEEQIIQQGRVPEEQLEMAVNMASKFQTPLMMLVMSVFGGALVGVVISLITSIFVKKNPSDEVPA
jgi:NhaP-type Na+/H+ or K+/H+ antiporter